MSVVPAALPDTTPDDEPIPAIAVLLLDHTPPGTALVRVIVDPAQTLEVPPITAGVASTVIVFETEQPPAV